MTSINLLETRFFGLQLQIQLPRAQTAESGIVYIVLNICSFTSIWVLRDIHVLFDAIHLYYEPVVRW